MASNQNSSTNPSVSTKPLQAVEAAVNKGNLVKNESASETDASGSTETLSPEERHTLKHTQRQDPQGQEQTPIHSTSVLVPATPRPTSSTSHLSQLTENVSLANSVSCNNDSNLSLGSSTNTLIIHHSVPDEPWSNRWLSSFSTPSSIRSSSREKSLQPVTHTSPQATFITRYANRLPETQSSSSSLLGSNIVNSNLSFSSISDAAGFAVKSPAYLMDNISSSTSIRGSYPKYISSTEITNIPTSYLDQSEVLKHLINKEKDPIKILSSSYSSCGTGSVSGIGSDQSASSSSSVLNLIPNESGSVSSCSSQRDESEISLLLQRLPPPPAYPGWHNDPSKIYDNIALDSSQRTVDKNVLSKSQPDLTRVGSGKDQNTIHDISRISSGLRIELNDEDHTEPLKEMFDILTHENSALKLEVDICRRKVSKLQKFEIEMAKVEEQHVALVKICERREQLERLARHKLNNEVRRLTELNNDLREQIDILTNQLPNQSPTSDGNLDVASLKRELNKRDLFIAQLVSRNKELIAAKERQEIELTAQRQTLNEQRTHIDILDSALTNAQTNVVKLEEEVRKKQNIVEQASQLKRLILSMKLSSDRREQSEKNLRQKLEMEILQLRSNSNMDSNLSELIELRHEMREKEEKMMLLEAEINRLEQRFLQESVSRQSTVHTDLVEFPKNRNMETNNAERDTVVKVLCKGADDIDISGLQQQIPASNIVSTAHKMDSSASQLIRTSPNLTKVITASVYSNSVSQVNNPSLTPHTPRRDEELGVNYSSRPTKASLHAGTSLEATSGNLQQDYKRSGSYCCYVCPNEQDWAKNGPDVAPRFVKTGYGGNLLDQQGYTIQSSMKKTETESILDTLMLNACEQNILSRQSLQQQSMTKPSLNVRNSLCIPASTSSSESKASDSSQTQGNVTSATSNSVSRSCSFSTNSPPIVRSQHLNSIDIPSSSTGGDTSKTRLYSNNNNNNNNDNDNNNSNVVEIATDRGNPPPYYSHHHQVCVTNEQAFIQTQPSTQTQLKASCRTLSIPAPTSNDLILSKQSLTAQSHPLPRAVVACQRGHPPSAFCRTCLNVRRSHRQNAAALVRRANSSGCQHNRRSAPSPASSSDSLEDAPSILERLKKEWEMGMLGGSPTPKPDKNSAHQSDGSKTLPSNALGLKFQAVVNSEDSSKTKHDMENVSSLNPPTCSESLNCVFTANNSEDKVSEKTDDEPEQLQHVDDTKKKDVAHLDRALNRLSMKMNSNHVVLKHSLKSYTSEIESSLLEATNHQSGNFKKEVLNSERIEDKNILETSDNNNLDDVKSQIKHSDTTDLCTEEKNLINSFGCCGDGELIILEDSDNVKASPFSGAQSQKVQNVS